MRTKVIIAVTSVLLITVIGIPFLRQQQNARSLAQAKELIATRNFKGASLCIRQVLQSQPDNLAALRMMAELAQASHSPQELDVWQQIVQLAPSNSNKLSLVQSALRYEDLPLTLAALTLNDLQHLAPSSPPFHLLSAELALRRGQMETARQHMQATVLLDPTSRLHQLNLAILTLQSTNAMEASEARNQLNDLCSDANVGLSARRALVADSIRTKNLDLAKSHASAVTQDPRASLEDTLQNLSIMRAAGDNTDKYLSHLKTRASTNSEHAFTLSIWLIRQGLVDEAILWLKRCPEAVREQHPAPMAMVDALVVKKDWVALERFLSRESWDELEFLRLGFLYRATAEQNHSLPAENYWRGALRAAGDRFGPMVVLARMARDWDKSQDYEELLWRIARRFPRERWAFIELNEWYTACANSKGLYRLYSAMLRNQPTNAVIQNNLATLGLILKKDLASAHQLASRAYATNPDNAKIACTYAYSLHLQGLKNEALRLLQTLKPEAVTDCSSALYYGLILAESGTVAEAEPFFLAARKLDLLPEERALLEPRLK